MKIQVRIIFKKIWCNFHSKYLSSRKNWAWVQYATLCTLLVSRLNWLRLR